MATHPLAPRCGQVHPARLIAHAYAIAPAPQGGPVTRAIRTMRAVEAAEPEHPALAALREGLERYFSAAGMAVDLSDAMCVELHRIREIREGIANRIEADLAILDAIGGSADHGDGADAEAGPFERGFASWHGEMFGGAR